MDDSQSVNHHTRELRSPLASGKAKLAEGGDLFKISLELREMIYEHYFSQEQPHTSPGSLSREKIRSTLSLKLPLLRTSKLVRVDALPTFYKCHVLCIRPHYHWFPDRAGLSSFITSGIQPMRKIELLNIEHIRGNRLKPLITIYLQRFLDLFPELRHLVLHFSCRPRARESTTSAQFHPMTLALLVQLVERLDRLEIVFHHLRDDIEKGLDALQALAPRSRWSEGSSEIEGDEYRTFTRVIWALQCSTTPKAPEDQASGSDNKSAGA